jgi:hypothetical protein
MQAGTAAHTEASRSHGRQLDALSGSTDAPGTMPVEPRNDRQPQQLCPVCDRRSLHVRACPQLSTVVHGDLGHRCPLGVRGIPPALRNGRRPTVSRSGSVRSESTQSATLTLQMITKS